MDSYTAMALEESPLLRFRSKDQGIVCALEPLEAGDWEEKMRLIDAHADELRGMRSLLDLETYRRLEAKGRLVIITARRQETGALIGYSSHLWYDDLHFRLRIADDDAWYVSPMYRGLGIGRALREKAHEELRKVGVKYVLTRLKVSHPHDEVIAQLGYQPYEMIYRKEL